MRRISDTIARLAPKVAPLFGQGGGPLLALDGFGDNPGALGAWQFVPDDLEPGAALVVVLHGCTQTAAGYDHGSGWSTLAARDGFALLYPEQARANNSNLCFNWFQGGDTRRGTGEAQSIAQMVAAMVAAHGLDPARVFVTGLSAGGAMAAVMLATYPEVFAGGAIIAGLPYGTAGSVPEAFERMRGHGGPDDAALAALARAAAGGHAGPWPTVSIWHGSADATVHAGNMARIGAQWRGLHGLAGSGEAVAAGDRHQHRAWRDPAGRVVVEEHLIAGMGHGTPLHPAGGVGVAGAYMLDVGVDSTGAIAAGWGLAATTARARAAPVRKRRAKPAATVAPPVPVAAGVQKVIEDALRAAGLMR